LAGLIVFGEELDRRVARDAVLFGVGAVLVGVEGCDDDVGLVLECLSDDFVVGL